VDFSAVSILCVGDIMLDRYVYGDMERISPEAPVPVLRLTRTEEMLGGVGNVANNIAALGGTAILVGLVGRDPPALGLDDIVHENPRIVPAFVESNARPTVCKTRFIAARQQVVRADEESSRPITPQEESDLLAEIDERMPTANAVILSDYGKGVVSDGVIHHVMQKAKAMHIPVFVDPKSQDFSRYNGATCITPNAKEMSLAAGMPVVTEEDVLVAVKKVLSTADAAAILVTRSEKGMMLVEASGASHLVPSRAREVWDVSGAGDTVIATLALAFSAGRTLVQAMHIANAAAGVVVSKLGTATADMAEVMHELDAQDHERAGLTAPGVQSLARIKALVDGWKAQGLRVGMTNGCFDIIHSGHVASLANARAACDRLIVALNADASISRIKGPTRPVNTLENRARVMAALRYVDGVLGFEEDTPIEIIRALVPDVLIKGADWAADDVVGGDIVRAAGGKVVLTPIVAGQSTTGTIEKILKQT
jgi:D-beta-D-heptose 7-phosphate kinase/D-beta-D-heptose 1-phosphate adenosyltransferase